MSDVAATIRMVREARARMFVCKGCGRPARMLAQEHDSRFPAHCEECDPQSATWRRERAERPLRAAILALDERCRELEQLGAARLAGRAARFGEPGREAVGRAVRRLAAAEGARGTMEALLDLAAVAQAWGLLLARPEALTTDTGEVDETVGARRRSAA